MGKLNDIEHERLDVAEMHLTRLVAGYKAKQRKGKDLERLQLLEEALTRVQAARLI